MNLFNSDDEEYRKDLVAQYENSIAQDKVIYLDPLEICDLVNWYATSEEYDKAHEVLKLGFTLHPNNTTILIEQAYLYLDLANLKEAKAVCNCINDDTNPDVILLKGEILLNEGKLDEADNLFLTIEEAELNRIEVLQNITQLYVNMGYIEYAIKWLNSKEEQFKENEIFIALMAEACKSSDQHVSKAIKYYNILLDEDPYNAEYWCGLSNAYFKLDRNEEALEAVDFALVSDEKSGEAYQVKANILFTLNDNDGAIQAYKMAMENGGIHPGYGYTLIGATYNNAKEWSKATEAFRTALDKVKNTPNSESLITEIYNNICISLVKLGNLEEAAEISDANCKQNPDNPFLLITDGKIKISQDDMFGALKSWERACSLLPEVDTYLQISDFLIEYGYPQSAFEYLKRAVAINPDYPKLYNRLALVCLINKSAKRFCEYNKLATPPITLSEIYQYINSIDTELREDFEDFLIEINKIENKDSERN